MAFNRIEKQGFGARTISPAYEGVDQGIPLMHKGTSKNPYPQS